MSTNKNTNVSFILQKLKFALEADSWKEVAEYLGVQEGTLSAWRKRNTPSAREKILYKCRDDVDENYLFGLTDIPRPTPQVITGSNSTAQVASSPGAVNISGGGSVSYGAKQDMSDTLKKINELAPIYDPTEKLTKALLQKLLQIQAIHES